MSTDEAAMGFDSPEPRSTIPNSVSRPKILGSATMRTYPALPIRELQVLPRGDAFDGTTAGGLLALGHEHTQEHDALALLAGDLGPVVGVGAVGQVLVLLELLADGLQEIVEPDALAVVGDVPLDGQLLGPAH